MICYFDSITDVCVGYTDARGGVEPPPVPSMVTGEYDLPDAILPICLTAEELWPYSAKAVDKA